MGSRNNRTNNSVYQHGSSTYVPSSVYQSNGPIEKKVIQPNQTNQPNQLLFKYTSPSHFSTLQHPGAYQQLPTVHTHVQHISNLQPVYHQSDSEPLYSNSTYYPAQQVLPAQQSISESTYYVNDPKNTLQKID